MLLNPLEPVLAEAARAAKAYRLLAWSVVVNPGWGSTRHHVVESVWRLIDRLTLKDSGRFLTLKDFWQVPHAEGLWQVLQSRQASTL